MGGMKDRQYHIMLGMNPPTKQGIGIKSKLSCQSEKRLERLHR